MAEAQPAVVPDIAFFLAEAKEWTRCLDALKLSIDSMYEICRKRNNIAGCEVGLLIPKLVKTYRL